MKIFLPEVDTEEYIIVTYFLAARNGATLKDVAWALAIGQSVGNPNVRNEWETDELFENHSCKILADEIELEKQKSGKVNIAFPLANLDLHTDGITQLLVHIMGGQLDIDIVQSCQVLDITFPEHVELSENYFKGPRYGVDGIRHFTGQFNKPILGGIVKPKVGITPEVLLEMVKQLVEGGVDFIKEDEIMSSPAICPIEVRVPMIMDYIDSLDRNVIYAVCINADHRYLIPRVEQVLEFGGNSVHVNFWSGLGCYKSIRELDRDMFLFFQKSGDKILTSEYHRYHINWNVICKLMGLSGVDFIHAGMWGGYLNNNEDELRETLRILHFYDVMPSLSCGMNPGLVQAINKRFGVDYMPNVGGAIHGHPGGTTAGALAMRQAIDQNHGKEYHEAIKKWGLVE
jgi:ribulose-bisphosphate carboxylase large chain